jgi:hypothetical protein
MFWPAFAKALDAIAPLHSANFGGGFTFVVNGRAADLSVSGAVAACPAVALQLSVDSCALRFTVDCDDVSGCVVSFLGGVERAAVGLDLTFPGDFDRRPEPMGLRGLCDPVVERAFLSAEGSVGLPFPADSISLLSVDAVDSVLRDCGVCIESECSLFEIIVGLGSDYLPLLRHVRWDELSDRAELLCVFGEIDCPAPSESVWSGLSPLIRPLLFPRPNTIFDSLIVPEFPALFSEFAGKRFPLLWRGSRDGFFAKDFHDRCDRHANTLTLIEDTKGNIFGGFTPVEWESADKYKADPSLKTFIFTLKNPHNFPAKKFALKAEKKSKAICCCCASGPSFRDIAVANCCNANYGSWADFGVNMCYVNDTGVDGGTFFTGSRFFTVKEIEVFEIAD